MNWRRCLGQQNVERQRLTAKAMTEARAQIAAQGLAPLIMLCNKEFPLGIAGPVAGKLSEEYYRPVIIVNIDEKTASGSCRSIPEFNIINALNQCAGLLGRFGGHAQAAGFTMPAKNIPLLQKTLIEIAAEQLKDVDLRPRINIDAEVSLSELGRQYLPDDSEAGAFRQRQSGAHLCQPGGRGGRLPYNGQLNSSI